MSTPEKVVVALPGQCCVDRYCVVAVNVHGMRDKLGADLVVEAVERRDAAFTAVLPPSDAPSDFRLPHLDEGDLTDLPVWSRVLTTVPDPRTGNYWDVVKYPSERWAYEGGKALQPDQLVRFRPVLIHDPSNAKGAGPVARNIVNQILDLAGTPVERRQDINDVCDVFVTRLIEQYADQEAVAREDRR